MSHLYVCHFSSGHIKVGRSIDPVARVAQHADRVACVGIELVEYRTFECAGDAFMAEAALIERCDTECTRRLKSEWFEGLTFESACEWACGCAKTDFQAAHKDCATDVSWPRIIKELQSRGVTQVQMSERCGCGQMTISDLLNGRTKNPRYDIGAGLLALLNERTTHQETSGGVA